MPICKKCGNRQKFRQHGYPTDLGLVRLSCKVCGNKAVQNTRFEEIFYALGVIGMMILLSPLIILVSLLFPIKHPKARE